MSTLDHCPRRFHCYRYWAFHSDLDEEQIWQDVQRWGGWISTGPDYIDFVIPALYRVLFVIKYPELIAQPQGDYL